MTTKKPRAVRPVKAWAWQWYDNGAIAMKAWPTRRECLYAMGSVRADGKLFPSRAGKPIRVEIRPVERRAAK